MAKAIGPNFLNEIAAAGLVGLPFSWGADGNFQFDARMTPDQITAVENVYAAHDPTKQPVQQIFANAIAAGCQVNSVSVPAMNGTYSIQQTDLINYTGLQDAINASQPWIGYVRDITSAKHVMTAAQATTLFDAILQYMAALDAFLDGEITTLPAQPVQIA